MSHTINLKKGFDIHLVGKAEKKVAEIEQSETFAIKPTDFNAISRAKLLVKEGDNVKAGTPIFYDKIMEEVNFVSPVSGEIVEVKRGAKRKLIEIKILADKKMEFENFKKFSVSEISNLQRDTILEIIKKSGFWPTIIQRPYGIIANPTDVPKSIFISAFNTNPLAPEYSFMLEGEEANFQAGLDVIKKLTTGIVHLNINGQAEIQQIFSHANGVQINKFSGPHPAGNVGVQIHHVDPINKGDIVWTIDPVSVAHIGKFFLEGKHDASKVVAITGSEVNNPQYVKTYTGANLKKILEGNTTDKKLRYISGNVLTGESVGKEGYLGFYHNQITVIPEGDQEEFLGWLLPSASKLSFHKAFGLFSFLTKKKERIVDTNNNGEMRNFVITGAFEKVLPMDILPTHLFKSIIANDYDNMEALGIYEVIEEDVALCEFIDVSKNDIQAILRKGIDLIRNS